MVTKAGPMRRTGLVAMTEREWQAKVVTYCQWLHLRYYHTFDSRRSVAGFPDLVIVGPDVVLYAELKSDKGRLTNAQMDWIASLQHADQLAYVWRPRDWDAVQVALRTVSGKLR